MLFSKALLLAAFTTALAAPASNNYLPTREIEARLGCYGTCYNNNCVGKTGKDQLTCNTMCDKKCDVPGTTRREAGAEPEPVSEVSSELQARLGCFGNCYNNNCVGKTGNAETTCHVMCDKKCGVGSYGDK